MNLKDVQTVVREIETAASRGDHTQAQRLESFLHVQFIRYTAELPGNPLCTMARYIMEARKISFNRHPEPRKPAHAQR